MDDVTRTRIVRVAGGKIGKFGYDKKGVRKHGEPDTTDDVMDCSEFVWTVYREALVPGVPCMKSHTLAGSSLFEKVDKPLAGDVVYWSQGHVAIVENPYTGAFIGSQSSTGVARSNYLTDFYWKARPGRAFYRLKGPA